MNREIAKLKRKLELYEALAKVRREREDQRSYLTEKLEIVIQKIKDQIDVLEIEEQYYED